MNGQSERVKGRRFLAENKSSWKIPTVRRWSYFGRPARGLTAFARALIADRLLSSGVKRNQENRSRDDMNYNSVNGAEGGPHLFTL
jgi:hypothetical protein